MSQMRVAQVPLASWRKQDNVSKSMTGEFYVTFIPRDLHAEHLSISYSRIIECPITALQFPSRTHASRCPTTAVKEVPLTGRRVKFLVFATIMGYKWFKVIDTVNAPLFRAPISPQ